MITSKTILKFSILATCLIFVQGDEYHPRSTRSVNEVKGRFNPKTNTEGSIIFKAKFLLYKTRLKELRSLTTRNNMIPIWLDFKVISKWLEFKKIILIWLEFKINPK